MLRAGDVVKHLPTGEIWTIAYADPESGYMAWCGWPEGEARISDCTLLRAADDHKHVQVLQEMALMRNTQDRRCRMAKAALARMGVQEW